jgi:hypothetical protein
MIIGLIVIISSFYYYDKIDTIARKQEVTDDDLEEQRSYTGIMTIILIIGLFLCVIGGMIFHKNYPPIEDREKKFESYNLPSKVGFECPSCGGELTFDNQINIWRCNDCYKYL